MTKKNLTLNWNYAYRNNVEYSRNKNSILKYELNSRKYNYSFKIYLYNNSPKLVGWDRNIKQSYRWENGVGIPCSNNTVLEAESENIGELKKIAQDFLNEKFKD